MLSLRVGGFEHGRAGGRGGPAGCSKQRHHRTRRSVRHRSHDHRHGGSSRPEPGVTKPHRPRPEGRAGSGVSYALVDGAPGSPPRAWGAPGPPDRGHCAVAPGSRRSLRVSGQPAATPSGGGGCLPGRRGRRPLGCLAAGSAAEVAAVLDLIALPGGSERQDELRRVVMPGPASTWVEGARARERQSERGNGHGNGHGNGNGLGNGLVSDCRSARTGAPEPAAG